MTLGRCPLNIFCSRGTPPRVYHTLNPNPRPQTLHPQPGTFAGPLPNLGKLKELTWLDLNRFPSNLKPLTLRTVKAYPLHPTHYTQHPTPYTLQPQTLHHLNWLLSRSHIIPGIPTPDPWP